MLPALIERARQEVALARVVGKFTVDVGIATLRRRLEGRTAADPDTSVESLVDLIDARRRRVGAIEALGTPSTLEPDAPVEPSSPTSDDRADQLVLPDYDHLPAAHIVAKLASLTQAERDAVEEYEIGQPPSPNDPRQARPAAFRSMIDPTVRRCLGDDRDVAQLGGARGRGARRPRRSARRSPMARRAPGRRGRVGASGAVSRTCGSPTSTTSWSATWWPISAHDLIVRIDQVWVTPMARELGFGDGLLEAAIGSARERGAVAVEGQALPGDRQTKNLYERAGIVARLITTYREL